MQRFTLVEKDSELVLVTDPKNLLSSKISKKHDSGNQVQQAVLDSNEIEKNEGTSGFKTGKSSYSEIPFPMMDTDIPIGYGVISNEGISNKMEGNANKKSKSTRANEDDLFKESEVIEEKTWCWCLKRKNKKDERVERVERVSNENINYDYSDNKRSLNNNLKVKLIQE